MKPSKLFTAGIIALGLSSPNYANGFKPIIRPKNSEDETSYEYTIFKGDGSPQKIEQKVDASEESYIRNSNKLTDNARTLKELKQAYKDHCSIHSNMMGQTINELVNSIILYGERHDNPIIPQPRDKSASLMSEGAHACAHKTHKKCYALETENNNIRILRYRLRDEDRSMFILAEVINVDLGMTLQDFIHSGEYISAPLRKKFINKIYSELSNLASKQSELEESEQIKIINAMIKLQETRNDSMRLTYTINSHREKNMLENIGRVIKQNPGKSLDVVTGAAHAWTLFDLLKDKYPDRPVILCVDNTTTYASAEPHEEL